MSYSDADNAEEGLREHTKSIDANGSNHFGTSESVNR